MPNFFTIGKALTVNRVQLNLVVKMCRSDSTVTPVTSNGPIFLRLIIQLGCQTNQIIGTILKIVSHLRGVLGWILLTVTGTTIRVIKLMGLFVKLIWNNSMLPTILGQVLAVVKMVGQCLVADAIDAVFCRRN